jgi:hypothetical protein
MRYSQILFALILVGVTACGAIQPEDGPDARGFLAAATPVKSHPLVKRHSFAGGDVIVVAPEDYCIDPDTVKSRGFAVVASCDILSNGSSGTFVEPVLMTVTVGPNGSGMALPKAQDLAQALQARLLSERRQEGLMLVQLEQRNDTVLEDMASSHWRGVFSHGNRMIGLALYAPSSSDALGDAPEALLIAQYQNIVGANPTSPPVETATTKRAPSQGLLGRLFNR